MRTEVIRQFGVRLRARIKRAGFSNISELLRRLGISHTLVTALISERVTDVGLGKIAEIAVVLGMKPSELVAELDDLLLAPPSVTAEEAAAIGLADWPSAWEPARLAIVLDVVEAWVEEADIDRTPAEIGAMVTEIYADLVRPDPTISLVRLRQRATASLAGIELPHNTPAGRGRGRPSNVDAA